MPPDLSRKIAAGTLTVGVIGLGYVGLPLAHLIWRAGLEVVGFEIDPMKIAALDEGRSYIRHFGCQRVAEMAASGRFAATADFGGLSGVDVVVICVPTPLCPSGQPDLQHIRATAEAIAARIRPGALVVLESTSYPGTTREEVLPRLEAAGLTLGQSVFLAYSPERENPGGDMDARSIPKVVGGVDRVSGALAAAFYRLAFEEVVEVSNADTAEAVKMTENGFRAVNIAHANELKAIYDAMGIDVWEVMDAAASKPFGFMPFYPGPGLGGHCIPIDPVYLAWRARTFGVRSRFIELAGEINGRMPRHVVDRLAFELDRRFGRTMPGARILVLGVAYKKNVDDVRESPALRLIDLIEDAGAVADFHDPLVPVIRAARGHARLDGRRSVGLCAQTLSAYDAALIATDHDEVDYPAVVRGARLVIDTRNATRGVEGAEEKVVRA